MADEDETMTENETTRIRRRIQELNEQYPHLLEKRRLARNHVTILEDQMATKRTYVLSTVPSIRQNAKGETVRRQTIVITNECDALLEKDPEFLRLREEHRAAQLVADAASDAVDALTSEMYSLRSLLGN